MIKKEERSKFLQKQLDEKEYSINYNFIKRRKGLDSTCKLLLIDMCNDSYMNGCVTWKQSTYGDHNGLSRQQVSSWFSKFVGLGILIPDPSNKPGGKSNTYLLIPSKIDSLIRKYKKPFKKNEEKGPVNQGIQTCQLEDTLPVNQGIQTCQVGLTYNKGNKSNKDLIPKEEESFVDSPSKDVEELEFKSFLQTIKLDI